MLKTLECSSKGDKRFSALYAKINNKSIENLYQLSKRFFHNNRIVKPSNFKEAKYWQRRDDYILLDFYLKVNNKYEFFSLEYLTSYYQALWYIYLNNHKELIIYAKKFDKFIDSYANKNTVNSQSEVINIAAKKGLKYLYNKNKYFIEKIKLEEF